MLEISKSLSCASRDVPTGGCGGWCHTLCCPAIFQVKLTHIQVKFKSGRGIVEREIKNAKSKEAMTMLFDVAKTLDRN